MFGLPKRQCPNDWADAYSLEHPKEFTLMAGGLATSRGDLSFPGPAACDHTSVISQGATQLCRCMHMPGTCAPHSFFCAFILKTQSDGPSGRGLTGLPFFFKKKVLQRVWLKTGDSHILRKILKPFHF